MRNEFQTFLNSTSHLSILRALFVKTFLLYFRVFASYALCVKSPAFQRVASLARKPFSLADANIRLKNQASTA